MTPKKGGLGKGLDALFADNATESEGQSITLKISEIEPNRYQPRKEFDEAALAELADSILQHGILQPLIIRPVAGGGYQLVAGERRWRASRMAGLTEVPAIIKELTDSEMMELALIENLQREDLNSIEEAEGYKSLMDTYGFTQEEVSKRVGKSRPTVANSMRLLNLPEEILDFVRTNKLSAGHARAILALDDSTKLIDIVKNIISNNLSVRETEKLTKKFNSQPNINQKNQEIEDVSRGTTVYKEVELALTEYLGRKVKILIGQQKGTIQLDFYSEEDLVALANKLAGEY